MASTPRIAIIGCGLGGIAAAVKLVQAGIRTFDILEQSHGIGGTWWDNRYPGAATDTVSELYSYSFIKHSWRGSHASGSELQEYAEKVVDAFGIRPHIELGTRVFAIKWDDARHRYELTDGAGRVRLFHVVISAVGMLNIPRYPSWPGLDGFSGSRFHTARWEHDHDLTGCRVAVVGTGSTAAQVVPALAPDVEKLLVFQREPGWILPKDEVSFTPRQRARLRRPLFAKLRRLRAFVKLERGLASGMFDPTRRTNRKLQERCTRFINEAFAIEPELREMVTPGYPFLCKRAVKSSDFYRALRRENVQLIPNAVERVTATGLVDDSGCEHKVDVLVMATGFEPVNYLGTLQVRGREGRDLHAHWNGEPDAFLGITVPGFPNLYILYGPNTNGGVILFNLERQAEYAVRAIKRMIRGNITAIEVRASAHRLYNRWLQRGMEGTAFVASCQNYFRARSGKVVTQWPYMATTYWMMCRFLGAVSSTTRCADRSVWEVWTDSAPDSLDHSRRSLPRSRKGARTFDREEPRLREGAAT